MGNGEDVVTDWNFERSSFRRSNRPPDTASLGQDSLDYDTLESVSLALPPQKKVCSFDYFGCFKPYIFILFILLNLYYAHLVAIACCDSSTTIELNYTGTSWILCIVSNNCTVIINQPSDRTFPVEMLNITLLFSAISLFPSLFRRLALSSSVICSQSLEGTISRPFNTSATILQRRVDSHRCACCLYYHLRGHCGRQLTKQKETVKIFLNGKNEIIYNLTLFSHWQ